MQDLDGVTHLSASVGSLFDSVFEVDDEKGGMDEDEHMEVEVQTTLPTCQGGRTNTDLPTDREKKLVDLISQLNSKFDSLSKTVYERFDQIEGRLQRVEDKVDMVFKIVDVGAQKRETRRSKHVKSPFTEIRYGKKKRTKIVKKEVREGEDGERVDKEEVGGGGEVEMKNLGVDLYRPIDEEKKKIFYAYFNDKGNDDCVKCNTGDYSREWFDRLMRTGFWLEDSHIDEVLTLMRLRQSSHSHVFDQHYAITDVLFGQQLLSIYELLQGKVSTGVATSGGKRKRMSEEEFDGVLADYRFDDMMLQYVRGERPKHGKSWANVKKVYCVVNIRQMHWVTGVWLLEEGLLEIIDCNPSICRDSELQVVMHPICKLFPRLLRDSGMLDHLGDELLTRTWRHHRVPAPTNDASADCGVYAIKFIEFNMANTPMDNLNDKTIIDFRERLAVECFHGEMDPCVVSDAA